MFEQLLGMGLGMGMLLLPWVIAVIIIVGIFDMVLRGIALWKAGGNRQLGWFIALFILSTAGILPIIYLLFFQKKKHAEAAPKRRHR